MTHVSTDKVIKALDVHKHDAVFILNLWIYETNVQHIGLLYMHNTTHGTYGFTSHPKDAAKCVSDR